MPVRRSTPGVYVEEVPSGLRPIEGLATSITAFVGRSVLGPVEEPVPCRSFSEFERRFGGLASDYPLSYAVRDFFENGGSEALILRLYREGSGPGVSALTLGGTLDLAAASPGSWGNDLRASLAHSDEKAAQAAGRPLGLAASDFFDLTLSDPSRRVAERFATLSVAESAGALRVDRVLATQSSLMRLAGKLPAMRPDEARETRASGGDDGQALDTSDYLGDAAGRIGLHALKKADLFNLLCIPPDRRGGDIAEEIWAAAARLAVERRAFLLVDPPAVWTAEPAKAVAMAIEARQRNWPLAGSNARNAALYFPRLLEPDPLNGDSLDRFVPCGAVAGLYARTDAERGVWKAPAGVDAALFGVADLELALSEQELAALNPLAVNALRSLPTAGPVVWGTRTLHGTDQLGDEYKYVAVRRLALFLEESLDRGTRWAVFEPNDEPLWAQIRLSIGSFMEQLFRQGAFQGSSAREAYFVTCGRDTITQADIDKGIVNIVVGFAPLRPAEFIVLNIRHRLQSP